MRVYCPVCRMNAAAFSGHACAPTPQPSATPLPFSREESEEAARVIAGARQRLQGRAECACDGTQSTKACPKCSQEHPSKRFVPAPDAAWKVGDKALWSHEDVTLLAIGPAHCAIRGAEGAQIVVDTANLRPLPKKKTVVVREFDTGCERVWGEKSLPGWTATGRVHEFEVEDES